MSLRKKIKYIKKQQEEGYYSVWMGYECYDPSFACRSLCKWFGKCENTVYYSTERTKTFPFTADLREICIGVRYKHGGIFYPVYISPLVLERDVNKEEYFNSKSRKSIL